MQTIDDAEAYFNSLGGLHDARLEGLGWSKINKRLSLEVDDINSCFLDTPDYPGAQQAAYQFEDVGMIDASLQIFEETLSVYEIEAKRADGHTKVTIKLSPGGLITFNCGSVSMFKM